MPLKPGKSKEAFSQNVEAEVNAGKPQKQAVAIAYSEQGESKKKVKKSDEPDLMYKAQERPYTEDINDLVEKGRGPDLKPRAKRETYKNHHIEQTGGSYTRMTESGSKTESTPHTEEHHITLPDGKPYHTTFSTREQAKAHIDKLHNKK